MIKTQHKHNTLGGRGGVGGFAPILTSSAHPHEAKCKTGGTNGPISVLDTRSPSPSTSTSTLSSFNTNPHANLIVNGGGGKDWVPALHPPIDPVVCQNSNLEHEYWGSLPESAGKQDFGACGKGFDFTGAPPTNLLSIYGASTLATLSGYGLSTAENKGKNGGDSNIVLVDNNGDGFQPFVAFRGEVEPFDQKVEILSQNAAHSSYLFFGSEQEQQNLWLKHQNVGSATSNLGSLNVKAATFVDPLKQQNLPQILQPPQVGVFQSFNFIPPLEMPVFVPKREITSGCNEQVSMNAHQQQVVYELVCEAAELIQAGNFSNAQGILARLNHVLAPTGKPFLRSAFYVKQALELAFTAHDQIACGLLKIPAPFDGLLKMGVYKVFSDVSPVIHFMNFTANQLLLEALGDAERIHIIDFDIGFGTHWSSFLQELPRRCKGGTSVKITAFSSPSTHHSLEICIIHENLTQFANDLGVVFELEVVNMDSFDPNINSVSSLRSSESEVIAVNCPIWSFTSHPSVLPSYLCLMKKLSPKILVSLSCKCEQIDLSFPNHILNTLRYYEALLDSVDAANVTSDTANKIEKFIFQPRIESTVIGRLLYPEVVPPWRNLFSSVGFCPASISCFAETQAECLLKRMQVGGFHVERKQASFSLYWRRCELLTVSAWNC